MRLLIILLLLAALEVYAVVVEDVTVVLNVFARVGTLRRQLSAVVDEQTVRPAFVWVCAFASPYEEEIGVIVEQFRRERRKKKEEGGTQILFFKSQFNFKYYGRFQLAAQAQTTFIAFYDDDQIPQPENLEFMLAAAAAMGKEAILGLTARVLREVPGSSFISIPGESLLRGEFVNSNNFGGIPKYFSNAFRWYDSTDGYWASRKNWCSRETPMKDRFVQVDALNRHWFMRKSHLAALFMDDAFSYHTMEDYTISMSASKYLGVRTFTVRPDRETQLVLLDEANACSSTDFSAMNEFRAFMINRMFYSGYRLVRQFGRPLSDKLIILSSSSQGIPLRSPLKFQVSRQSEELRASSRRKAVATDGWWSSMWRRATVAAAAAQIVTNEADRESCVKMQTHFCLRYYLPTSIGSHRIFVSDLVELLGELGVTSVEIASVEPELELVLYDAVKAAFVLYEADMV